MSVGPRKPFFRPPALFELGRARYGWSVGAGIGAALVVIGLLMALLWLRPELARRDVDPVSLLVVFGTLGAAVFGAVRLVRGPPLVAAFDGDSLSLRTTSARRLCESAVSDLECEPVQGRLGNFDHPAVRLHMRGYGRRLLIGVNYPLEHLPWRGSRRTAGEPSHWVEPQLWLAFVERLGLAAELGQPAQPFARVEPPSELAETPPWQRYAKLLPFVLPILLLPALMALSALGTSEPEPECLTAARCCLARLNAAPPVEPAELQACTAVALGDADRCVSLRSHAEQEARAAGTHCDESLVKRYARYDWTAAATELPAGEQRQEPGQQYPRVSCREAAMSETQTAGEPLVVRPTHLMTQAVALSDPNATLYCEGYPLPVFEARLASSEAPVVAGPGPHAVLLRPLPSGRFELGQYCLGCNRVGQEPRRR